MSEFKVGDRIEALSNHDSKPLTGFIGTVRCLSGTGVGIEFDNDIRGHSCYGLAKDRHGWFIPKEKLKLHHDFREYDPAQSGDTEEDI